MLMMMFPSLAFSQNECTVPMYWQSDSRPEHEVDPSPKGVRAPARPVIIYINSEEGVVIQGVGQDEVLSYEAYDMNSTMLASFTDGVEFANYVLNYTDTLEIRINLSEYSLRGYISL